MNYEGMSDFEINKEVAFAIRGQDAVCVIDTSLDKLVRIFNGNPRNEDDSGWVDFDPCNNPADAWPIIIENAISLTTIGDGNWHADTVESIDCTDSNCFTCTSSNHFHDNNPLRAAMICFLKMKDAEK